MACHYRFTLANGLPPREDRFDVVIASDGGETLHLKLHGPDRCFLRRMRSLNSCSCQS
jgi:hypothetical protein